ncbi:MAG TPA: galactokinase family protein, partial [Chloroflexota bacterium]
MGVLVDDQNQQALNEFRDRFRTKPELLVRAPGRVNLIGGHLDYHEGFVLPVAIDRVLTLIGRRRDDDRVRIYSPSFGVSAWLSLGGEQRHPTVLGRYCQGAIVALRRRCDLKYGCDALVGGDLPAGAGLSSSSALVVAF